jgi:hypothetical protein
MASRVPENECKPNMQRLRRRCGSRITGTQIPPCGSKFFFNQKPLGLISSQEEFYPETFVHAFDGKGSPDEMRDTLRIALAIGRIGTDRDAAGQPPARPTAAAYATDFMTLDCNGLVGNYYGGNPSGDISSYAVPGRRRTSIGDVKVGDAIVTHCAAIPYEHVGLIQEWSSSGSTATVRIVEWGWYGGEDVHYSRTAHSVEIKKGPESSLGIGWVAKSNRNSAVTSFRYIFAPPKDFNHHGWS